MSIRRWMPRSEWEHLVPESVGKIRANHKGESCSGDSDSLIIERRSDGSVSAHCFRCGGSGFIGPAGYFKPPVRLYESSDGGGDGHVSETGLWLPDDASGEWGAFPVEAKKWLLDARISPVIIADRGFMWSDSKAALYIPVQQEGDSAFGRKIVGHAVRLFNPKGYFTKTNDKDNFYGYYKAPVETDTVVLVEDVLSAIRVAEVVDSISLMGVHVKPAVLSRVLTGGYKRAIIFLDGDNPQVRMKAREAAKRLSWLPTRIVETGTDPKRHSKEELDKLLGSGV